MPGPSTRIAAIITWCVLLAGAASQLSAQGGNVPDEAALAIMLRGMAVQAAGAVQSAYASRASAALSTPDASRVPPDASRTEGGTREVRLRLVPEDAHPIVLQVFSEELARLGIPITASARRRLTLDVRALSSSAVSRAEFSYVRRLDAVVGVLLEEADGSVLFSREFTTARSDTLDGAPCVAYQDFRTLPAAPWMEGVLIPIVIAAAAVVAVVLLFTVRGS